MDKKSIFKEIYKINSDFINSKVYKNTDMGIIKKIVEIINSDKRIIISGIDFVGKTETIKNLIEKTRIQNKSLYFNKRLDYENKIKNSEDLKQYIDFHNGKHIKFLFLQNIGQIKDIKDFLQYILKTNLKIIIIGNDIKIQAIKEIEIKVKIGASIKNELKYGKLGFLSILNIPKIQKNNILLIKDKIILDNIFNLKSVKDIILYNSTLSFLSKIDGFKSVREIYNSFSKNNKIAIKTFTDYLEYSEQAKIIKKINLFDLKKEKEITTKNRYYFLDNGILNCLNHFRQKEAILIKNLIFIKLHFDKNSIFGGRFGNYEFDFFVKTKKGNTKIIKFTDKENFKRDLAKFKKINANKKYLIFKDFEDFNPKKKEYDNLKILSLEKFLEK